jgi:hypothetical protein
VIELSDVMTAKKIEARFGGRVSGRRPCFTEEELIAAVNSCATALGRVPLLAEYDDWRLKELALMRTRGQWPRVASAAALRRRFKTWEGALLAAAIRRMSFMSVSRPPSDGLGWPRSTATPADRGARSVTR